MRRMLHLHPFYSVRSLIAQVNPLDGILDSIIIRRYGMRCGRNKSIRRKKIESFSPHLLISSSPHQYSYASKSTCAIKLLSVCLALVTLSAGCESGKIANLSSISMLVDYRYDALIFEIFLKDASGHRLLWDRSILRPGTDGGVISTFDLETDLKIFSLKENQKHKKVYEGGLSFLRWNSPRAEFPRVLIGELPREFLDNDPDRDAKLGIIELTLITPNQGSFSATTTSQIYP